VPGAKGIGIKISRGVGGGSNEKKDRKIAKKTENSTIKPLPGEGEQWKKNKKYHFYVSICYICTMYKNPGGAMAPCCRHPCQEPQIVQAVRCGRLKNSKGTRAPYSIFSVPMGPLRA